MNKTKIEWVKNPDGTQGFTSNPIKGYCPIACSYCYSRRDYDRFGWDKTIRFDEIELGRLWSRRKLAGIFIGSMHEIFMDDYIEWSWTSQIILYAKAFPQHRIYLLTKQPQNLIKFSPFPDNCFVGITATNQDMYDSAVYWLHQIEAKVKYISIEPFLSHIHLPNYKDVDWLIFGSQTKPYKPPEFSWLDEAVRVAVKVGTPVFLKNNLLPLVDKALGRENYLNLVLNNDGELRQEFPK